MTMNFGREQALLRQRLTEQGSPERIAEQQDRYGDQIKCLGASDEQVCAAANDLAERFPSMGRAQTTAFVRTLWSSKTHDLRCVAAQILSRRADLLEPADVAFLEGLLKDSHDDALRATVAIEALGELTKKHKKVWKDLQRLAKGKDAQLRVDAIRAAKAPCASDGDVFERFEKLARPLMADGDEALLRAVDEVLASAAADAARAFAAEHERKLN